MIKADYEALKMEQFLRLRERGELVWVTKSKKVIPIKNLSDEHLANIINIFESEEMDLWEGLDGDWQG